MSHLIIYQMIAKVKTTNGFYVSIKKGGDVFLKVVRVVVEDITNRHNNFGFGFRIKEKLLEDENQMFKNMSKI